ncbi:VOC family protein [Kosakonia sp. LAM2021]|uniref:VOC family protein n=1 Tax=Kosakonia sp. LAM2021 TaxID=2800475 RepID=UPI00190B82F7|nr:VOC family protein [Kosakonia sp. LAM2021]
MKTLVNWFELPVQKLDRAVAFYEHVLGGQFRHETVAGIEMAVFPHVKPATGGALVKGPMFQPVSGGTVVYLATANLAAALERVREKGGECCFGPEVLPQGIGTIALIIDSEGNRVGLHQPA